MPTPQGTRLTEQHRRTQLAVRAAFLREMTELWPSLNPVRLDATAPSWLRSVLTVLFGFRQQSARVSSDYYTAFRAAETGRLLSPPIVGLDPLRERQVAPDEREPQRDRPQQPREGLSDRDRQRVITSLTVTGPVRVKQLTLGGKDADVAAREALVSVTGAAARHVLDGGRDVIETAVQDDELATGWARVSDGNPCSWCALLISRGPSYKTRESAEGTTGRSKRGSGQKYHDHCGCGVRPVFDEDEEPSDQESRYLDIYTDATAGLSGKEAMRAFRRAYEAQQREVAARS